MHDNKIDLCNFFVMQFGSILVILSIFKVHAELQYEKFGFKNIDPEVRMNVTQVIRLYGYPAEEHEVLTEDGYFLSLQRIPYGLQSVGNGSNETRRVVYLQHGLLDSSFTWVNNRPDKSLAFILADKGFDVWMGNSRGNVYSNRHKRYSKKSIDFWNFSWDEMAKYDLPASIEYVLKKTGAPNLSYVGHSQGTTTLFAQLSKYSDLRSKISSMVALAPVAYVGNIKSGVRYLAYIAGGVDFFYKLFTHGEFLPSNILTKALAVHVCGDKHASLLCGNILFLLSGPDSSNFNYTRLPVYVSHNPAGTSSKNMNHFAQGYKSNEFQMYDHGFLSNIYYYGQTTPPKYKLNTHGVPVAMFWGEHDLLADQQDVNRAIDELGDNVKFKKYVDEYNHMDFIWAKDVANVIYRDLIDFINKYN